MCSCLILLHACAHNVAQPRGKSEAELMMESMKIADRRIKELQEAEAKGAAAAKPADEVRVRSCTGEPAARRNPASGTALNISRRPTY